MKGFTYTLAQLTHTTGIITIGTITRAMGIGGTVGIVGTTTGIDDPEAR
jgi:hypothetical protein